MALAGFLVAEHRIFPYSLVARVEAALLGALGVARDPGARDGPVSISTVHVGLRLELLFSAEVARGEGGGLTSVGSELVLMSHDGQLFGVTEGQSAKLKIDVPDNGLADYSKAAQSPRFEGMYHVPEWLRYNDILHYRNDDAAALVISYTEWRDADECYGTTVAKLDLPFGLRSVHEMQAAAEDWTVVYRTQPCLELKSTMRAIEGHMAGGRIAFQAPRTLLLASGDYHWDGLYAPEVLAQSQDNDYGKVLAIDLQTGEARHMSSGNRNMQGILVDANEALWVTEHGPRGGDELNLIVEGNNYGWPKVTFGTRYNGLPWPDTEFYGRHDGYVAPVYSWLPSIGISNLIQVDGFHAAWHGDLLVASMARQALFRLRMSGDRVVFAEPIEIGQRVRYVHQHSDGQIYLWTDRHELLVLSVDDATPTDTLIDEYLSRLPYTQAERQRVRVAISGCQECHSFEAISDGRAPALGDVFERTIGSSNFAAYSAALKDSRGAWSAQALAAYIADPQAHSPGTTMPVSRIGSDSSAINGIIDVLRMLKTQPE
jgi:cytochrome c2